MFFSWPMFAAKGTGMLHHFGPAGLPLGGSEQSQCSNIIYVPTPNSFHSKHKDSELGNLEWIVFHYSILLQQVTAVLLGIPIILTHISCVP